MTTFQDPQPQSRRAVRQSERGQHDSELGAEATVGFTQFPPATPAADAPPVVSGRRAAAAAAQQGAPTGEPLTYSTQAAPVAQAAPAVPSYDGPSFRPRSSPSTRPPVDAQPPTQAMPQAEQPAYRVRDFSPEGRRSAPTEVPAWNAPAAPVAPASYAAPPLEPAAPVAEVPPSIAPGLEQTLSRRERRALQEAELAASIAPAPVAPAAAPVAQQFIAAPVAHVPAEIAPAPAVPHDEARAWPFGDLFAEPVAAEVAPVAASAPPVAVAPNLSSVAPEPSTNTALTNAIAEFDALTQAPVPQREIEDAAPSQWTPPLGHWSVQTGLDDETQPYENTINRTVGSGSVTTNALVLPSIPQGSDIRGPLTGTGEIMLTGSIDLPHAFTSTGATARVEHEGIDALFDLHDAEVVTTDSQPVRAISAVSTHNSGQGVTHTQKPKGTRALTALVISAASMAVVVVGLLVAVFALNIF